MEKEEVVAKVAFLAALNRVQGLLEPVSKDSVNPHFKSKYASLGAVNQSVMGPLSENGFVLMSGGVDIAGKPYLRTTLAHIKGHSESFDYPIVNDGNPQHIASSVTYGRRYALCALLNLSVEDDDGNAASPKPQAITRSVTQPPKARPTAQAASGDIEIAQFIPKEVMFVEGKGSGAGKTFSEIIGPDGTSYSGYESHGEMAEDAKDSGKEIRVAFKRNGKFINVKSVSILESAEIEEVPF